MENDIKNVRKQFVFILNYAVDILKKEYIESDDLVLFSKEVTYFNQYLDKIEIPEDIYDDLKKVYFDYSAGRKNISDSMFLFFKRTPINWIQQRQRREALNNFLERFDTYLDVFDK